MEILGMFQLVVGDYRNINFYVNGGMGSHNMQFGLACGNDVWFVVNLFLGDKGEFSLSYE